MEREQIVKGVTCDLLNAIPQLSLCQLPFHISFYIIMVRLLVHLAFEHVSTVTQPHFGTFETSVGVIDSIRPCLLALARLTTNSNVFAFPYLVISF